MQINHVTGGPLFQNCTHLADAHALSHHRSDDGLDCRNQREINSVTTDTSFPAEFHRLGGPVHRWASYASEDSMC